MNLTEWARAQGVHPQTAYRWFREGTLPVPAVRVNQRTVLVCPDASTEPAAVAYGLYARVSSHDQREDLDRQVARLTTWAADADGQVVRVEAEVGSEMGTFTGSPQPRSAPAFTGLLLWLAPPS